MKTLKTYTRGIDKKYYSILFDGMKVGADGSMEGEGSVYNNMQKANEFLIMELASMTQEEVDGLPVHEYENILKEIDSAKKGKVQST